MAHSKFANTNIIFLVESKERVRRGITLVMVPVVADVSPKKS